VEDVIDKDEEEAEENEELLNEDMVIVLELDNDKDADIVVCRT
jgi:hypothetical protein